MEIDRVCTMSNTNIIIPNDLTVEIFSRVPAKSLLRLRWACKYLFDLITRDRAFIMKNYLYHHTTTATTNTYDDDDDDDNRIVNNTSFWVSNSKTVVYTMKFADVVNNDHDGGALVPMDCFNLPFGDIGNDDYLQFCDSCNGLILMCKKASKKLDICWLWNPCTREVRQIPNEPSNIYSVNDSSQWRVFGFGYDQTIQDYKVIRITHYYSQPLDGNVLSFENHLKMIGIGVYTLGSNSWSSKIITDPILIAHYKEQTQGQGLLVNGALHWIARQGIGAVTSFDIVKEKFREIEGPNMEVLLEAQGPAHYDSEPFFDFELSVLNGCLCICQIPKFDNYIIWMMKDYGVKDSWTKLFTINVAKTLAAAGPNHVPRYYSEPFEQYYKDGGILMVFNINSRDMIIVACDSKNDKARFIYSITTQKKYFGNRKEWFRNGTYTESLVSLNSGIYLTLATGSRTLSFQKQDLLEYKVRIKLPSKDKYLVRKDKEEDEEVEEVEED